MDELDDMYELDPMDFDLGMEQQQQEEEEQNIPEEEAVPITPPPPPPPPPISVDELKPILMPVLEQIVASPNSVQFRTRVTPEIHENPNYDEIIKNKIDLSIIKHKLITDVYDEPRKFCDDMELMLRNCKIYNRPISTISTQRIELHSQFYGLIDPVMQRLGFCCGREYRHMPEIMVCHKANCLITPEQSYWIYQGNIVCHRCFEEIDEVVVMTWREDGMSIPKVEFQMLENDFGDLEEWVYCQYCQKKFHQICVMHLPEIWPNGFYCNLCSVLIKQPRAPNQYRAELIPKTNMDVSIETYVNDFLANQLLHRNNSIKIRTMCNQEQAMVYLPRMRRRFEGNIGIFPYLEKTIYAFQEIDGQDVLFFGFTAHEYGSNCLSPNKGRIYITHIDSVPYFKPQDLRPKVYKLIILGYLKHKKQDGYRMAHAMIKPISDGQTLLFRNRPLEQKTPTFPRLKRWFNRMMTMGRRKNIVRQYKNIFRVPLHDDVRALPYFADEHWPERLEYLIEHLPPDKDDAYLCRGLERELRELKDQFMCIRLLPDSKKSIEIRNLDPIIISGMSKEKINQLCAEQKLEFSSLRRAKFSTMALVFNHLQSNRIIEIDEN